jgi:glycosyltransferase involved in cell wall biosynthesis
MVQVPEKLICTVRQKIKFLNRRLRMAAAGPVPVNSADVESVAASGLFDRDWYLRRNPDIRKGIDPIGHYLQIGWLKGREPGPLFRSDAYLALQPEARKARISPLLHYLRSAGAKAAQYSPRIDADWEFLKRVSASAAVTRTAHQQASELPPRRLKTAAVIAAEVELAAPASFSPSQNDGRRPMNIVMINHGPYDSNSAIHIAGFANALTALGHRVVVSAVGTPRKAADVGAVNFRCIPHQLLAANPKILKKSFAGSGDDKPDLIHCWTPRPVVKDVARSVLAAYGCPYIVHFEDNEAAVSRAYRGVVSGAGVAHDMALPGSSLPSPADEFVAGAVGATVIVDSLRELLPKDLRCLLLEPGIDPRFAPTADAAERRRLCDRFHIPCGAWITVYPGNVHPANAEDVFSLYAAIHALNALGHEVHLIRTGIDSIPVIHPRFAELCRRYVTDLGFVRRSFLIELLKIADFFVQPGGPDDFNNYRLPSKVPDLLATGRPVVLAMTNIGLQLQDRVNALLMQRGDAAEITDCVAALLTDPALADRLGAAGRLFAERRFSFERSGKALETFYQDLINRRPR